MHVTKSKSTSVTLPELRKVREASETLKGIASVTPMMRNQRCSEQYLSDIWLKREDLQQVRSYKIRGAYNKIYSLGSDQRDQGIVCASAGNHSQGVALSCSLLQCKGTIFMPAPTPRQKVDQVRMFGGEHIEIILTGDTFDDAYKKAVEHTEVTGKVFVHPFDDLKVIEGQATVGLEILEQTKKQIDYLFVAVGGGGLASGLLSVFQVLSPHTKIIGVEPEGAPSMKKAMEAGTVVELHDIDKFVDGAAVQRVGETTFAICRDYLHDMITVPEGRICQEILDLYNKDAIVVEPAGALTLAALDQYASKIRDKHVVCIVSGSNNDITRMAEIKERALLYARLKHYFIVRFPQRAGALKEFVAEVLGPDDDITHFEYSKKHARENGPAVVGIELKSPADLKPLIQRMKDRNFYGDYLNDKPDLFQFLI